MLPKMDGFQVMESIRPLGIPVIFLTAMGDVSERVKGLKSGAEDYIVKPFEPLELLARIEIVLRRFHRDRKSLEFKDITVNLEDVYKRQALGSLSTSTAISFTRGSGWRMAISGLAFAIFSISKI